MTKYRTDDESLVIRTKKADKERDKALFKLAFGAGVSKATKDMMLLSPSEQMNYRKHRRKVVSSEETLNDMLDYFDEKHT